MISLEKRMPQIKIDESIKDGYVVEEPSYLCKTSSTIEISNIFRLISCPERDLSKFTVRVNSDSYQDLIDQLKS